jgi:hypothetical protein
VGCQGTARLSQRQAWHVHAAAAEAETVAVEEEVAQTFVKQLTSKDAKKWGLWLVCSVKTTNAEL